MPPISLRLEAFHYLYLFNVKQAACYVAPHVYTSKEDFFDKPTIMTVAGIRIKDPQGIIFPKKGKRITLTVPQAVALHTTFSTAKAQLQIPVLQLFAIIDKALTDYNTQYGYKD